MKNLSVNFPNEIIDSFNIEGVFVSPYLDTLGWAFLSETKNNKIILRIYVMETESESLAFELVGELAAFTFSTHVEMKEFYEQLLNMSALEYMVFIKDNTANNLH